MINFKRGDTFILPKNVMWQDKEAGVRQIDDAEIGTGMKYITDSDGRPLVFTGGMLRTLSQTETLLI